MKGLTLFDHPTMKTELDAVVIGSGPNGLAAAVNLARKGYSVKVFEAHGTPGGSARTAELTLPGFHHDVCSAIHPMGAASPFFNSLPLEEFGLEWIHPEIPIAHPLNDGSGTCLFRSVEETANQFDSKSARTYRESFGLFVEEFDKLLGDLTAPLRFPRHPLLTAVFGFHAAYPGNTVAEMLFADEKARALLAGNAAHSVLPLEKWLSPSAIGMMLMSAGHAYGWPLAKGGSRRIIDALIGYLESCGGKIETGCAISSIEGLPNARAYLFDTTPSAMARIANDRLPARYRRRLLKYRHGPGVFKIDYALDGPVPWKNEACRKAGTVHVGGTLSEIRASERAMWEGEHSDRPFVLTAQQSLFDESRAPEGKHTFWAYCHVPTGSTRDMTEAIESQIERFAPGFRDRVLARRTINCADYERYNPNLIGGDIVGGVADWRQLLARPVARRKPHTTPASDIFLCSSSTPPGGGVHGMCGYWASEAASVKLGQ